LEVGSCFFPTARPLAESTDSVTRTDPGTDSDLDLVRRARGGDAGAFGELVDRNRRAVFRAALAALGSRDEADDVAQEAFVAAFRKLDSFRVEASFKTWVLAIAWRKALDRRRSVARWVKLTVTHDAISDDGPDLIERMPALSPSQEQRVAAGDLHRIVKRLIAKLPRKLRDALLLAGSGEHSYDEIARMLDIPVGTVKWRVSEARRVLKQKLAALGYAND
jgi:RNA polymerase sigma-70 factor, ECF subfamily